MTVSRILIDDRCPPSPSERQRVEELHDLLKRWNVADHLERIGPTTRLPLGQEAEHREAAVCFDDFTSVKAAADMAGDTRRLAEIEAALFPNGTRSPSELVDVGMAYVAAYYGAPLLAFYGDGRQPPSPFLAKAKALKACGVTVVDVDLAKSYLHEALWATGASIRFAEFLERQKSKE